MEHAVGPGDEPGGELCVGHAALLDHDARAVLLHQPLGVEPLQSRRVGRVREVVDDAHLVTTHEERVTEMVTDEPDPTRDEPAAHPGYLPAVATPMPW